MRSQYTCSKCGHTWIGRKNSLPVACPNKKCQSRLWNESSNQKTILQYEDFSNQGGQEWDLCMFFDDKAEVIESCMELGINVATIEVPFGTVDVTWRDIRYPLSETRPAAHPSERGCYTTMPLVLCQQHINEIVYEAARVKVTKNATASS